MFEAKDDDGDGEGRKRTVRYRGMRRAESKRARRVEEGEVDDRGEGASEDLGVDCALIFDERSGTFTLERVDGVIGSLRIARDDSAAVGAGELGDARASAHTRRKRKTPGWKRTWKRNCRRRRRNSERWNACDASRWFCKVEEPHTAHSWRCATRSNARRATRRDAAAIMRRKQLAERIAGVVGGLPAVEHAVAYGSAVLTNASFADSTAALDVLVAVSDPVKWHEENMRVNPSHYALQMRMCGAAGVDSLARTVGGGDDFSNASGRTRPDGRLNTAS